MQEHTLELSLDKAQGAALRRWLICRYSENPPPLNIPAPVMTSLLEGTAPFISCQTLAELANVYGYEVVQICRYAHPASINISPYEATLLLQVAAAGEGKLTEALSTILEQLSRAGRLPEHETII